MRAVFGSREGFELLDVACGDCLKSACQVNSRIADREKWTYAVVSGASIVANKLCDHGHGFYANNALDRKIGLVH